MGIAKLGQGTGRNHDFRRFIDFGHFALQEGTCARFIRRDDTDERTLQFPGNARGHQSIEERLSGMIKPDEHDMQARLIAPIGDLEQLLGGDEMFGDQPGRIDQARTRLDAGLLEAGLHGPAQPAVGDLGDNRRRHGIRSDAVEDAAQRRNRARIVSMIDEQDMRLACTLAALRTHRARQGTIAHDGHRLAPRPLGSPGLVRCDHFNSQLIK